jgi:hypothetical protein
LQRSRCRSINAPHIWPTTQAPMAIWSTQGDRRLSRAYCPVGPTGFSSMDVYSLLPLPPITFAYWSVGSRL